MALSLKHAMTICKIIANITLAVFFCYAIKKHNIKKHRIKTHDDTHGHHNHVVVLIRLMPLIRLIPRCLMPHFSHYVSVIMFVHHFYRLCLSFIVFSHRHKRKGILWVCGSALALCCLWLVASWH